MFTRRRMLLVGFILTLLLLSGSLALAQGPAATGTTFTYQGRLAVDGEPATGSYDFRFTLYDSADEGANQVGALLTRTDVAVTDGQFTVQLDFGDVFTGDPR